MRKIRVAGSEKEIEVGKLVCLLRSYRAHAEEMKSAPSAVPEFFLKPASAIIENGGTIILPKESMDVHHEVELAVVIGKTGRNIQRGAAMEHVFGYAVLIDVTARDIQAKAKKDGKPWTSAKGYDTFAPMSEIVPKEKVGDPHNLDIWLKVNGEYRQKSNTKNLLFSVGQIIEYVSGIMTLEKGDIIATGTPEGVSQIVAGDVVEAGIQKIGTIKVNVKQG
jgi:acylpyruvate hydrolase